jgi:hypothetical protein
LPRTSIGDFGLLHAKPALSSALREYAGGAADGPHITRRQLLAGLGLTLLGAACTTKSKRTTPAAAPGSIDSLIAGAAQVSVLGTGADAPPMNPGSNRLGVVLLTLQNSVIEGGTAQMWVAEGTKSKAMGPYAAPWYQLTAYEKTHDRSPKSPLPGVFAAEIELPAAGIWSVAVTVQSGSRRFAGTGVLQVTSAATPAQLGSKAIRVRTPVATSAAKIREICTRTPVDDMHYTSLDDALSRGKPTVISFATPLLCSTRTCGPVVDEQLLAFEGIGRDRANFIHVEEFLPGKDLAPPAATPENLAPAFKAWGFDTDPWLVIVDKEGVIRFRTLGIIAAAEIERALQPLL